MNYILIDGEAVKEPDIRKWGKWFEDANDRVTAWTETNGYTISTVFLGMDHSYGQGPPILWETMYRDDDEWQEYKRYSSQADALAGHEECCKKVIEDS